MNWQDINTLCSRIAVFTNGQIFALGSSGHIRAMLADGHTARLKLKLKPIRTSISLDSISDTFSGVDETENDAEEIKRLREKRQLAILEAIKHFNDPDDDESDSDDDKNESKKSTQHDSISAGRETSSQQAARDERRLYLTSHQGPETTETEADDSEEVRKVYRKSRHNFAKIQLDDEDHSQADNANPDRAQATGEEPEISETGNVPNQSIESDNNNTANLTTTSQPTSVQLQNVEPVTSRAVAERIHSKKDQDRPLEDRQSNDERIVFSEGEDVELGKPVLMRDDSNSRFFRANNLRGTVYDDIARGE